MLGYGKYWYVVNIVGHKKMRDGKKWKKKKQKDVRKWFECITHTLHIMIIIKYFINLLKKQTKTSLNSSLHMYMYK